MKILSALVCAVLLACNTNHRPIPTPTPSATGPNFGGVIQHIVIIFQENRTPDNLFQCLPASFKADIASSGLNSQGQTVPLQPKGLEAMYDIGHQHANFVTEYDNGQMDGFDQETGNGGKDQAYKYVPCNEEAPYVAMAENYVFGDRMFQSNQGPSLEAHQYIISGSSSVDPAGLMGPTNPDFAADNPGGLGQSPEGGCDSRAGTTVTTLLPQVGGGPGNPVFPCFERPSLGDELNATGQPWRYYQAHSGPGLWNAYDAILHDFNDPTIQTHVVVPSSPNVLNDIGNNDVGTVTWVIPPDHASDHSGRGGSEGPAWVSSIVNAIGNSPLWSSTVIIVTWDDWGGWYDHVAPPVRNSYELGMRVPLLVISPYTKGGVHLSHEQFEFGSILLFAEQTFGLPSLGSSDAISNSIGDVLDTTQHARQFVPIPAPSYQPNVILDRSTDED